MPDITLCHGGECTRKAECYRFTATPSPHRQSYFASPPFKDGACDYFSVIYKRTPGAGEAGGRK